MHGSFVPENLNYNSFYRQDYRNLLPIFALISSHMNKKFSPNKHPLRVCAMSSQLQNATQVLTKEKKFIHVKYIQKMSEPPLSRTILVLLFPHVVKTSNLGNWRIIATFPPISMNHLAFIITSFNDGLWCASVRYNGHRWEGAGYLIAFKLLQQLQSDAGSNRRLNIKREDTSMSRENLLLSSWMALRTCFSMVWGTRQLEHYPIHMYWALGYDHLSKVPSQPLGINV